MTEPTTSPWTAEIQAKFNELMQIKSTLTYDMIANRLNTLFGTSLTKNACISQARRITEGPRPRAKTPRPAPKPLPDNEPGMILDLGTYDCRWIINDKPAEALYCRRRQIEGCSYCATHAQKAFPAMGRH